MIHLHFYPMVKPFNCFSTLEHGQATSQATYKPQRSRSNTYPLNGRKDHCHIFLWTEHNVTFSQTKGKKNSEWQKRPPKFIRASAHMQTHINTHTEAPTRIIVKQATVKFKCLAGAGYTQNCCIKAKSAYLIRFGKGGYAFFCFSAAIVDYLQHKSKILWLLYDYI